MRKIGFLFVLVLGLMMLINPASSLIQAQYNRLLEIRTSFNLETIFPEPIDFCSQLLIIQCVDGNSSVGFINIKGIGSSVIPSFTVFDRLTSLSISNATDSNDFFLNSDLYLPPSLLFLSCSYCGITKLPSNSSLTTLNLKNNPIAMISSGEYSITNETTVIMVNPDPLFADYLIKIKSDCEIVKLLFVNLGVMINEPTTYNCFLGYSSITLQIGPSFGPNTNLTTLINSTFPSLLNSRAQVLNLIGYPNIAYEPMYYFFSAQMNFINLELKTKQDEITPSQNVEITCDNSIVKTIDGGFLYNISKQASIAINSCGITKIYPEMFQSATFVSLKDNGITGPFPNYLYGKNQVLLDGNEFTGELDRKICENTQYSFSYNKLTGKLPSCFSCYLNSPAVRTKLIGNQFSNYNNDNIYPVCDTVVITSFANFSNVGSRIIGFDLPPVGGLISSNIPNITFTLTATNGHITVYYRTSNIPEIFKYKEFIVTIHGTRDFTFTFPVSKPNPQIFTHIPPTPYRDIGYSFTFIATAGIPIEMYLIKMDNSLPCEIISYDENKSTTSITCVVKSFSIPEKILRFTFETSNYPTIYYDVPFIRKFPVLASVSSVRKSGGLVTMYGLFGENLTNSNISQYNANIGSLDCNIKYLESSTIICLLGSSNLSGPQNVTITSFNIPSIFLNVFVFMEESKGCENSCSGHGFCNVNPSYSYCLCDIGWGGSVCSYRVYYGAANHNGKITEISQDQVRFGLTIVGIQEISFDGKLLKERIFDRWNQTTNNETIFSYTHLYEDSIMGYQIEEITQQRSFEFAGYNMSLDAGTFKLTANVSNWVFISSISSLQLLINTSLVGSEDDCTQTEINSFGESTLTHITIEKDGKIFYGKFIDRMLSDGKPTYSSTKIVNQTSNSILLGISLPHCTQCILDPDFSILISNKDQNGCKSTTTSNRDWVVPTAVVVSIVGAAIIGTIIAVISSRFYYIKISRKGVIFIKKEKKKSGTDGIQMS